MLNTQTGICKRALASEIRSRGSIVERAPNPAPAAVEHVGVNHCRRNVAVSKQFLDSADVVACAKEMGGERVPQRVTGRWLADAGDANGSLELPLQYRLMQVVAPALSSLTIHVVPSRRTHPLPGPLPGSAA